MTNNFTPKKSGTAARPQLSPEEYAAKKKTEKDAVYQMIDDTATEIVVTPTSSGHISIRRHEWIATLPPMLCSFTSSSRRRLSSRIFVIGRRTA